jgi:uncharacterized membrane protein
MTSTRSLQPLYSAARGSYLSLIVLVILWEGWLAPSTYAPPAVWLTLKSVPLLLPLRGVLLARPRSIVIASLVLLLYMLEAIVLLWVAREQSLIGISERSLALIELVLTTTYIGAGGLALRATGKR